MFRRTSPTFDRSGDGAETKRGLCSLKARIGLAYAGLIVMSLSTWIWAFYAFADKPLLLGVCLAVFGLGLRHALDADHIAAIDNVTRRIMQAGHRPVSIGLYFALGHSSIVVLATAALGISARHFEHFGRFQVAGSIISACISSAFLIFVAAANICIFLSIWRRRGETGRGSGAAETGKSASPAFAPLTRILRPVLNLVTRPGHMFLILFIFGLGFDTATEVAMFGVSAAHATQGVPFQNVLIFPALFAAGMSLMDTTDGIMMLGAYNWAFLDPRRKIAYNLSITAVSIAIALFIAAIEILSLLKPYLRDRSILRLCIEGLEGEMDLMGIAIVCIFILCWILSVVARRRTTARADFSEV